jgi:hypothetical protein
MSVLASLGLYITMIVVGTLLIIAGRKLYEHICTREEVDLSDIPGSALQ